ncbi:uncharacterized protein LOC132608747 isoform X9 [Lycium barbarum]|uniref:uncharacterized protein LOC132608747 isoform X9 n=1 Tax=Lycium barbarum TaxID=112863 RepID=UPI00293ED8E0|nr:uncharacterized protein LOC132608747 isoform X9 [Lycium barbarum]
MWILRRYAFCTFTRAAAQQIPVLSRVSREKYKEKRRMKYVLVTGGVSLNLSFMLADPYLNTDAGTMSPFEHGEVFVLDDGGEGKITFASFTSVLYLYWGSWKTKPTQHSVRELRALGLIPHFLACRSAQPLVENAKQKLSQFCHVPVANILNIHDVPNIWHVPLLLRNQSAHDAILKQLDLLSVARHVDLQEWTRRAETSDNITKSVRIAMVGKYVGLTDSYLSVVKALMHACIACSLKPSIDWIAASDLEDDSAKLTPEAHAAAWKNLRGAACVLVPGGFGDRGVKGMILAARYARENSVPFLGICLGMQISVIEFARSVLHLDKANSEEFDPQTPDRVVIFMPEGSKTHMGSTMRLGSRRTLFQTPDCIAAKLYNNSEYVDERHRHRYEVNPDIVGSLEEAGLKFVGRDESGKRMEILELQDHPFYIGVQFHPEFKSRPGRPSAPFLGLVLAATGQLEAFVKRQQNGNV